MKRFVFCLTITLGLTVLILPGLAPTPAGADPAPLRQGNDIAAVASLEPLQGLVQHQAAADNPADSASWQTLTASIVVAEGDRIRTDKDGLAVLTFFEGVETQIGPSTLAVVSTLELPTASDPSANVSLDVLVGSTLTTVDAVLNAGDRVEIYTPSATAAVRGTKWWTVVSPQGDSTFIGERGLVGIFPHVPGALMSELGEHHALRTDRQGKVEDLGENFNPPTLPEFTPLAGRECGDGICQVGERLTCRIDCRSTLDLPTCGNGTCDQNAGEDLLVCAQDCAPFAGEQCGNGVCEADESGVTCPADCKPDQYFTPVDTALCGNAICDPTETALTCPTDCHRATDTPTAVCTLSGNDVNIRSGPGTEYPAFGALKSGEVLPVIGQDVHGAWFLVDYQGEDGWVSGAVVTLSSPCTGLAVHEAPPPPVVVEPPTPVTPPGTWGACGSCSSCGTYPAQECMTNPDGACVWNPAVCRPQGPPTPGSLTVPQNSYSCVYTGTFSVQATYTPPTNSPAVIASHNSTPGPYITVTGTTLDDPHHFTTHISCTAPSPLLFMWGRRNPYTTTITSSVTDTEGRSYSVTYSVTVN